MTTQDNDPFPTVDVGGAEADAPPPPDDGYEADAGYETDADSPPPAAGGGKKWLVPAAVLGLVALGGGMIYAQFGGRRPAPTTAEQQIQDAEALEAALPGDEPAAMADAASTETPPPAMPETAMSETAAEPPPAPVETPPPMMAETPPPPVVETPPPPMMMAETAAPPPVETPAPPALIAEPLAPPPPMAAPVVETPPPMAMAQLDPNIAPRLDQLEQRLAGLEGRIEQLATRIEGMRDSSQSTGEIGDLKDQLSRLERKIAARGEASPTASKPRPRSESTAPKPSASRWVLKSATSRAAWVAEKGGSDLRQIVPGDDLAGIGRIRSIRQINGRWTVEGSAGVLRQ